MELACDRHDSAGEDNGGNKQSIPYHSRFEKILISWLVFEGTKVHGKSELKSHNLIFCPIFMIIYPKQLIGIERKVWQAVLFLLLVPLSSKVLQGIVGELEADVVRDVLGSAPTFGTFCAQ